MDVAIENIGCSKNSDGGSKKIDWFQQKSKMVVAKINVIVANKSQQQKLQ